MVSAQIAGGNTPATSTRVHNNSADNEKPGCYEDELPPRAAVAGGYSSSNLVPPATSNSEGLQRHMHRLLADGLGTGRPQLTGQPPSVLGPSSAILTSTGLKRRPDGPPDFTSGMVTLSIRKSFTLPPLFDPYVRCYTNSKICTKLYFCATTAGRLGGSGENPYGLRQAGNRGIQGRHRQPIDFCESTFLHTACHYLIAYCTTF